MRIVAVEEHFTFPDLLGRIDLATLDQNGWPAPGAGERAGLAAGITAGPRVQRREKT